MAMHIVNEYQGRHALRQGMRRAGRFLGALFIAVGLGAATIPVLLGFLTLMVVFFTEEAVEVPDEQTVTQLLVLGAVACAALLVGLRLVRGRRRIALFLRRFRFSDATATMTYAIGTAVGRGWRLVTLDDAAVVPVGVTRGQRRASRIGLWLPLLLIVGAALWLFGGPGESFADRIIDGAPSDEDPADFGAAVSARLAATFGVLFLLVLALAVLAFLAVVSIFSFGSRRAIARAESAKAHVITRRRRLDHRIGRIVSHARRVLGPRLIVVRVVGDLWRDVVDRLLGVSAVAIVDVSEVSPNVIWEVEAIERHPGVSWIAIGQRDRLHARTADAQAMAMLAHHLGDRSVLAYDTSAAGLQRFSRSLRDMLEDAI